MEFNGVTKFLLRECRADTTAAPRCRYMCVCSKFIIPMKICDMCESDPASNRAIIASLSSELRSCCGRLVINPHRWGDGMCMTFPVDSQTQRRGATQSFRMIREHSIVSTLLCGESIRTWLAHGLLGADDGKVDTSIVRKLGARICQRFGVACL